MTQSSKSKVILGLSLVLAAGFIVFGVQKFGATNPVFSIIAERSGIDLFEPLVRRLTGVAELATAILLLIPNMKSRLLGSVLALGVLGGAIVFHLSPWLGINVPDIGHGLFFTAVAMFVLNGVLLYLIKPTGRPLHGT